MPVLIEHDREIAWPTHTLRSEVHNTQVPSVAFAEVHGVLPVIAWLHKDALIARLDAEINTEADDKSALTHEARQKAEAEVMGDLLKLKGWLLKLVGPQWATGCRSSAGRTVHHWRSCNASS